MTDFHAAAHIRVARKSHTCDTCYRHIQPGEEYATNDGVFDGRWYHYAACSHCRVLWRRVWQLATPDDHHDGIYDVDDWLREEAKTLADLRLLVGRRRRWTRGDGVLMAVPEVAA